MFKKFFKPIHIAGASALISITSFLSYAMGLARDRVLAVNFGTTTLTDTYNASFQIPDMLFNFFIAGALQAAFLPIFSEYLTKNKQEAYQIAGTVLTAGSIFISIMAILAFIFIEPLVHLLFPTADLEMRLNIMKMTRLMLPTALIFALSNALGNILMTYKHFFAYALSPILYNLGIIIGIVLLKDQFGIYAASIGVLIGAVMHLAIRIFDTFFTDFKFKPQISVFHPGFKKIIKLMIPKSIGLIATQVNLYVFTVVGIKLTEGGVSAFNFARNIQSFPVSLFGIAFATAIFPYLSSSLNEGNEEAYTYHIRKTMQRILFFSIPAAIGIMILSRDIVSLILSGGVFGEEAINLTSLILFFFAISIPFEALVHILARAFYAKKNTITPTAINVLTMSGIAMSTIFLAPKFGIKIFSLGFSIGLALQVCVLLLFLKKHLQKFNIQKFLTSLSKTILASGIMAISILILSPLADYLPQLVFQCGRIIIAGTVFFLIALLVKSEEIHSVNFLIKKLFKRA